jgi:hypothetical protein
MRGAILAALVMAMGAVGCYSPNPPSGQLRCGPRSSCPEGYNCADGLTCWKDGQSPSGSGGAGGRGGSGGSGHGGTGGAGGAAGGTLSRFIGTWTFVSPSTRTRVCTDGTNETIAWTGDFFDVAAGVSAPLTAYYYCDWNLDVSTTGTSTVIRGGTSCSAPDPNVSTTNFTWTGQTFTLTTTNGRNATLDASLPYSYTTSAGSGSCTMHFTGTLTKS